VRRGLAKASTCTTRTPRRPRRDALDVGGLRQSGLGIGDTPAPLALYPYPVACEIRDHGFRFFDLGDVVAIKSFLEIPDYELYAHNLSIALEHFNVATLPTRLRDLLDSMDVR